MLPQKVFRVLLLLPPLIAIRHSEDLPAEAEIIDLPVGRFPDPKCRYNVHHRDGRGAVVTSEVRIGEQLFHSWECSYGDRTSDASSLYCLMVNNCTVADTRHKDKKVALLDEFGCSLFPSILPHVSYDGDLAGGLTVSAFSLDVEQAAVFFECNIKLLLKLNGVCRRPTCPPLQLFQHAQSRLVFTR